MTPVDGISAPRAKRPTRKKPSAAKKSAAATPVTAPMTSIPTHALPTPETKSPSRRSELLMWASAIIITAIICIVWIGLYSNGRLTDTQQSSFFGKISQSLSGLIKTIQTDWLKLQDALDDSANTNAPSEERIRDLEEHVFPQFEDPTKQ